MMLKNTTKKNFVQLFLHLHSQIDFEEFEKNGWMAIYYNAMDWYNQHVSTAKYVLLEEEDIEALLAIRGTSKTLEEISHITGMSLPKIRQKAYKLVSRGLVISYLEEKPGFNKKTYYKIAPLGEKELLKQIF